MSERQIQASRAAAHLAMAVNILHVIPTVEAERLEQELRPFITKAEKVADEDHGRGKEAAQPCGGSTSDCIR